MKASFLAVAVLATIAISSAVDEECVQRKLRGLAMHWPNPKDCGSFYRCTNKNVKRQILCPPGKEYNTRNGRCGPAGRNLCKLSLRAALDEPLNSCVNEISGTYVADGKYCRNFNICNNKLAYPQTCNAGSYFDTTKAACVPDVDTTCWENFCLTKDNGAYLVNDNDCYSFYVCANQETVAQDCPAGSYFDKQSLNCQPGICPADAPSTITTTCTTTTAIPPPSTTSCTEVVTTPSTTTCTEVVTTPSTTTPCTTTAKLTTPSTTTCTEVVTTPTTSTTTTTTCTTTVDITTPSTTTCTEVITTSSTTTTSTTTAKITTPSTTTCTEVITSPSTTTCTEEITTPDTTVSTEEITTPPTTTCTEEITTLPTTPCTEEITTSPTTTCTDEITTLPTTTCTPTTPYTEEITTSPTTTCTEEITTPPTTTCTEEITTPPTTTCTEEITTSPTTTTCKTTPEVTTTLIEEETTTECITTTTPEDEITTTTPCIEVTTTPKVTTPCAEDVTTTVIDDSTPIIIEGDCPRANCDQSKCVKASDYTMFPALNDNNHMFCACLNQEAVCRECPEGSEFLPTFGACFATAATTPSTSTPCAAEPETVTCKGGITEGDIVEDPDNCMQFLTCFDGELVAGSCGTGNFYNQATQHCEQDVEGQCPQCSSTKSRNKRSIAGPIAQADDCCPGGYHNGDVIAHPTDCDKKLVCCNGVMKVESCDEGYYFNAALKECVIDINNVCPSDIPSGCVEGQVQANPLNCSTYFTCCHGVLKEKSCNQGYIFKASENACVEDVNNECWPKVPKTCSGGILEGNLVPNAANCSTYFKCIDGDLEIQSCGYGYYYNAGKQICQQDINHICWPDLTPTCQGGIKEGDKIQNPANCSSYLVCCNSEFKTEFCGYGMVFDSKTSSCQADTKNVCWPKEPSCEYGLEDGETIGTSNCSAYLKCCNGQLTQEFCGYGMLFNNKTNSCQADTTNVCWPKEPSCDYGLEEGETIGTSANCSAYLVCCNGQLTQEFCGYGMLFNNKTNSCQADTKNVCWPKEPSCDYGLEDGDKIGTSNCSAYLVCCNGQLTQEFCGYGMLFNNKTNSCQADTTNVCWPKEPSCDYGLEEGETIGTSANCSAYLVCCNGQLTQEFCGYGMLFNNKTNSCQADTKNVCWPKEPSCDYGLEDGDKIGTSNCSAYLVCCSGKLTQEFCGYGMLFNNKTNSCQADTKNVCWPKEPSCDYGLEEGDTIGTFANCSAYLKCCNGKLTQEFCGYGMLFNNKTNSCQADTKNVCWPKEPSCDYGLEEGDTIGTSANCSAYLKCCNGKLTQEFCGYEMLFNNKTNSCQADTKNVCWPKEPSCDYGLEEGDTIGTSANCSVYLKCCNGKLTQEFCGYEMLFNNKTNSCQADTKNVCWPKEPSCDYGLEEGDTIGTSANCSAYLKCCNGKLTQEFCGYEMLFNNKTNSCQADTKNVCWPKEPSCDYGLEEGDTIGTSANCSAYLKCCNGKLTQEFCGYGMLFNNKTNSCQADTKNVCWPKEPSCDYGLEEGDTIGTSANCSAYLKCCNGKLTQEFCGYGMLFNNKTNSCQADTKNVCWPKEPCCDGGLKDGDIIQNPANCSSYLECCSGKLIEKFCGYGFIFNSKLGDCEADTGNVCWPKESCIEGEKTECATNCSSFYRCCGGVLKEEFCEEGYYFDSDEQECVLDVNHICWPYQASCTCEGDTMPVEGECDKMLICLDGIWQTESCGKGSYFNNVTMCCQPDTDNSCWPKESCTCPGGYEEGDKLQGPECYQYYTCTEGHLEIEDCDQDYYFNNATSTCELDTCHRCWPDACVGKSNGTMLPNPTKCNAFYFCINGESTDKVCETGEYFNTTLLSCQPDLDAVCYNPCSCQSQIKMKQHPECNKFYFCNGNQTIVETCPIGGFDPTIGDCNPKMKCTENECEDKPDYYVFGDPLDNTKFFVCIRGVPILKSCLPGTEFNGEVCAHVSDPDCDAKPCLSSDYVPPYATLNKTENDAFCFCRMGYATKQYCAAEYTFDPVAKACHSNAPCDPIVCKYSPDYRPFVNRNSTKSFCLCADSTAVIVPCPNNGTFNPITLACSDTEISPQCSQTECVGKADYYTYADTTGSTDGFCMCKDQVGTYKNCPENSSYNVAAKVCQLKDIQCSTVSCKGVADNTKLPALISPQGYCECVDGTATFQNCPDDGEFNAASQQCVEPLCNPLRCVTADDYYRFPANGTTDGFCMCLNHEVEFKSCEEGGVFNTQYMVCQMPLINCGATVCAGQKDNTKLPATYSVYGYCLCSGGKGTFQDCPTGLVFDNAAQACGKENLPLEAQCDVTYCDDPAHAGQNYPSLTDVYGYCQCSAQGPKFVPCPDGELFDAHNLVCRPTASSQCDLTRCASATANNGYPIPTITGNTSFCYCTGPGTAMLINCPTNLYYNNAQKKCIPAVEQGCSCPGGLKNNDVIPDPEDCTQYFECISGSMQQQSCPAGQYFNTQCDSCQEDTDGICIKKEACTCLGTYREGERLVHPYDEQMYYVCENQMLHERNCGIGRVFNIAINQCMRAPRLVGRFPQKRSVDVDEFFCINDEKRSVPSNCSQYELCVNQTWKRRSCSDFRYYNPEQKKCLEPRDDMVCVYAKVTTLPECNELSEKSLYRGRSCQQYFRCQKGKWRLKSCDKNQYYNVEVGSCLPHNLGDVFDCRLLLFNNTKPSQTPATTCTHLSMRPYERNCAMYLMCIENQWWYEYCPLGMYFNQVLSYCMPDATNICPKVLTSTHSINTTNNELIDVYCPTEGLLRPSALACNRFYICVDGQWKQQNCAHLEVFDAQLNQCSSDSKGLCQQLKLDCQPEEKRPLPLNCSAYEKCSNEGNWQRWTCPQGQMYDDILQECTANDAICSNRGLRRMCAPQETRKVHSNCSLFYHCVQDTWTLASCLKGHMYWEETHSCVPHNAQDKCQPLRGNIQRGPKTESNSCLGQLDGVSIAHPLDCTRYYICVQQNASHELQCSLGSYFDSVAGFCKPNDGSCRLPLTGACENAADESLVAHPTDCQFYYLCSSLKGQQLLRCPEGEFYHNYTRQCRIDHGECQGPPQPESSLRVKCHNVTHGAKLAHELYCNIYYICVKGLPIAIECPNENHFNPLLNQCMYDSDHVCQNGQLVEGNHSYSCGNLTDGSYIADRRDCTRYYICSLGKAQPKKCAGSTFFDSQQLLCVPDDGSCPFVDDDEPTEQPVPPDPIACEGKHGNLMPDPLNCNNFYVCVNSKLRHERCYPQHVFNVSINQCQQRANQANTSVPVSVGGEMATEMMRSQKVRQCSHEPTSVQKMCEEYGHGTNLAEQGDCRFYITCQEDEEPLAQRCRNGESYDSLLGFCRQNDGTCQLDIGQRAGECSERHGQYARDMSNCRRYFTCINGQKIAQSCQEGEYFSKADNMCHEDILKLCNPEPAVQEPTAANSQTCTGLSESILYPYIADNCRSYFQCVSGKMKVHQCADNLYFDPIAVKCVKNRTECVMGSKSEQRTPIFMKQTYQKLCSLKDIEQPYPNVDNKCRSFYTCHSVGEVSHELCPLGMAFDKAHKGCVAEENVKCF